MLEREFDAEHKESETPDEEESSEKFDSQSDDDSSGKNTSVLNLKPTVLGEL